MSGTGEPDMRVEFNNRAAMRPASVRVRGTTHQVWDFCEPFGLTVGGGGRDRGSPGETETPPLGITGNHNRRGILLGRGPGIREGTRAYEYDLWRNLGVRRKASVRDLAPTLLYSLGLPVPRDMEGEVLTGPFTDEHQKAQPVRYISSYEIERTTTPTLMETSVDEAAIQKLRALGYLR